MIRIKICGITNVDDAAAACRFGADALGFIFVPGSPRYLDANEVKVRNLIRAVPPFVWKFGVFDTREEARQSPQGLLDVLQYYNEGALPASVSMEIQPARPLEVRAFRVRDEASLTEIAAKSRAGDVVLLDAYSDRALGGTGHRFNWDLATQVRQTGRAVILAGGLTAENVGEAVRAVQPYMVDVSSGVESVPGRKDHEKLWRFIRAVREADLEISDFARANPTE